MDEKKMKNVLRSRFKKEIEIKARKKPLPIDYVFGYIHAMQNVFWDLFEEPLITREFEIKTSGGEGQIIDLNFKKLK